MTIKLDKLFSDTVILDIQQLTYIQNYAKENVVRQWLQELVELELGEAAKQIFVTLLELRNLNCEDTIRCQLLGIIEPILAQILISLEKHYLNQSLLETKRDQQIAELVLEIKSLYALIYSEIFKRTQRQLETRKFSILEFNLKKKLLNIQKTAALNALYHLTQLLHSLHLIYLDIPKRFWLLAYSIYHLAKAKGITDEKIESNKLIHLHIQTLEQAFKELLLLHILNSHKLRQAETRQLMLCIPYWVDLVNISNHPQHQSKYELNFYQDQPPKPYMERPSHHAESYFLDTYQLKNYITETLGNSKKCHSEIEEKNLSSVLKFHILSILDENNVRKSTRYSQEGEVELLLGITSAHFFLSKAKHFKETLLLLNDTSNFDGRQLRLDEHGLSHHEIQISSRTYAQRFNAEISKIYTANLVNRSDEGMCLQWTSASANHLRTGRFILFRERSDDPWTSGIVRWIKSMDHEIVQFGIELFTQHMCPAAVRIVSKQQEYVYHPAIILVNHTNQYTIILQSSQIFSENQNLLLRLAQEEIRIFLKTGSILTSNCARFEFDVLEPPKRTLLQHYIEQHAYSANTQDLWESLK
ncbi:hypothetical protein F4V57_01555 [Acinetobacter qingfengensis]|uniref:GTPase n=1 Tax=Acinetobacter qingfengensis TaxID=1262585 RepID=A0A1E7R988_9GAMM|nr:hypothetical protein [Acinetobacter qingfengensis]KAA8735512.1 hypothetical protein F4V57_01555 [Acinetobacter qingfengensis]OEY95842.1 hypothetical protein BJI46_02690 [Acinetobacter qingfengensis]